MRLVVLLCLALLSALVALGAAPDAAVTLATAGQPPAPIVVTGELTVTKLTPQQEKALPPAEREARREATLRGVLVEDLAYHLERMTGQRPPIIVTADPAAVPTPAIVLGELAGQLGATPAYQTTMAESFRLLTRDGRVLIGGESLYGVSHGVYQLLRELGCDWLFPGPEGELIPRRETLAAGPFDLAKKPAFEVRSPWYSGGRNIVTPEEEQLFAQWKRRHQQTHPGRQHPLYLTGGHFWFYLLSGKKALLTEHPEMRALNMKPDGTLERGWAQLESTNPAVVDLVIEELRAVFEKNGWPKDQAVAYNIGPNDGTSFSISPESLAVSSRRMDPVSGEADATDLLVHYINQVLERTKDEFPNLYLGMLIYGAHGDYPMRYRPHPRFALTFADITQSRFHSLLDTRSATRTYYRNILEQWGKLHAEQGNPMGFYGYNWNLAENLLPYSKMKIWGQDLPYYHRMGVIGHNNEQDKAWSILGPHDYLMARMGWDMDLDWRQVLKQYCTLTFGPAAPHFEAYYLDLIETQEAKGIEAGAHHAMDAVLDQAFLARAQEHVRQAAAAAQTDVHRRNVDYFSQPVGMLAFFHQYRQAARNFDFVGAKAGLDAMVAHFEAYQQKNSLLVSRYGRRYLERLQKPFVEQGLKYSTGEYRIVYPLPDALPTIFDPHAMGQHMGLYLPERREEGLLTTRTYSTTWAAQGLGMYRPGAVWYRVRFALPADTAGQGIGLFIGAAEDEIHVWCNGEYIGSARGFPRPFQFDLTKAARPGAENLIALQVIKRSMINEIWLGGLVYPSFVFAGPQLPQIAPNQTPLQRVLPGAGGAE
jgi:hypothetical protein